ncbi:MAG: sugar transferase [Leucobacter sp.]
MTPSEPSKSRPTSTSPNASGNPAPSLGDASQTNGWGKAENWRNRYAKRLWVTDLLLLLVVVYGTQVAWLGRLDAEVTIRDDSQIDEFSYTLFSIGLVVIWMWALALSDSRRDRVVGTGGTEYVYVIRSSVTLFGLIAIAAFLLRIDVARGYLLISLPVGVLALVLGRWLWRKWLVRQRKNGTFSARVLLVGMPASIAPIAQELTKHPGSGYRVVGACLAGGPELNHIPGTDIPVLGRFTDVGEAIQAVAADTVAVTSTGEMTPLQIKQLSWKLKPGRQHLVFAPSMTDIAGPRIRTRPVAGLPLVHVETPRFSAGQRLLKRMMDLILGSIAVVLLSPVLLIIAALVKFTSPGPVLFKQLRTGLKGAKFRMLKFRSMVSNAEDLLPSLLDQRDSGNDIMFKMTNDPRVTKVGRFIRKYSLDELPQLFNVLGGSMSLVGPRPPLPNEVEKYADHVHRRFLMKPGITGAWQVSGRSSLSWEDSVRLDLGYVENWSLLGDFVIMLKTVKAALRPGATAH